MHGLTLGKKPLMHILPQRTTRSLLLLIDSPRAAMLLNLLGFEAKGLEISQKNGWKMTGWWFGT
jgi:hypothetical protein